MYGVKNMTELSLCYWLEYDTSVNACDSVNVGIYVYKILMKRI